MKKNLTITVIAFCLGMLLQVSAFAQVSRAKAWVYLDNPTAATSIPLPAYQFNSSGALNTVTRLGTGFYRVDLPGLGTEGGMAQVAAYGGSHFCTVESWVPLGTVEQVFVRCFTSTGAPTDGRFTLLFYKERRGPEFEAAYVWANEEASPNYTPSPIYQWNSNGSANTVRRLSAGQYEVFLPGVNILTDPTRNGGHVQVSAYGANPRHAVVQTWYSGANGSTVRVNTFDVNGNFVDTKFMVSFMTDLALGASAATDSLNMYGIFLWADQSLATSYTPDSFYQSTNGRNDATVERISVGKYRVTLPGLKTVNKTTALVSGYGCTKNYFSIASWVSNGMGGTIVEVQCRNMLGQLADGKFTLLYLTNDTVVW